MHYNPQDNRYIFTNGILKKGVIRISIHDNDVNDATSGVITAAANIEEENDDKSSNNTICRVRDINLSSLFDTKMI